MTKQWSERTIKLLGNCYIRLVEVWGSDEAIIESARMSTDKGFQGWGPLDCPVCLGTSTVAATGELAYHHTGDDYFAGFYPCGKCKDGKVAGDEKLLRYLYTHGHLTPFEHAGAIFEVQAPIFVFREWHRHRTQSYNELSARYTELPDLFYQPSFTRLKGGAQVGPNKQSSGGSLSDDTARTSSIIIAEAYDRAREAYEELLELGVAREVARIVVPVGQISRMRASANLRNWLQFLDLRCATNAQYEIKVFADAIHGLLGERFPRTIEIYHAAQNE